MNDTKRAHVAKLLKDLIKIQKFASCRMREQKKGGVSLKRRNALDRHLDFYLDLQWSKICDLRSITESTVGYVGAVYEISHVDYHEMKKLRAILARIWKSLF